MRRVTVAIGEVQEIPEYMLQSSGTAVMWDLYLVAMQSGDMHYQDQSNGPENTPLLPVVFAPFVVSVPT